MGTLFLRENFLNFKGKLHLRILAPPPPGIRHSFGISNFKILGLAPVDASPGIFPVSLFECVSYDLSWPWRLRSHLLCGVLKKLCFPTGIWPVLPTCNYSSSLQPYQSPWFWGLFVSNLSIRTALLRSMSVEAPCSVLRVGRDRESWHVSHYLKDFWEYRPWTTALTSRVQRANGGTGGVLIQNFTGWLGPSFPQKGNCLGLQSEMGI